MGILGTEWAPRHKLTVADYHRLGAAGVLSEDDRVELIDGEIMDMAPIGSKHASMVARLAQRLIISVGDAAVVYVQNPIFLSPDSEPQPDLALLRPREDFYAGGHPGPRDVFLVIEVAESSARYYREIKLPLYARHGIGEVWLVDLEARRIELHRAPAGGQFTETQILDRPGRMAPRAFPDLEIDLTGMP